MWHASKIKKIEVSRENVREDKLVAVNSELKLGKEMLENQQPK